MSYEYLKPANIESASMSIIAREFSERGLSVSDENRAVTFRVIHTSADFDYGKNLRFTEGACREAVKLLREGNFNIITDTNMALSGISKPSLEKLGGSAHCFMADAGIAELSKARGCTRAAASMEYAASKFPGAFFAIGNAPTALIKLSELIRDGYRPSFIAAVPVGFVNVAESKEEIFALCRELGIPGIAAMGRKGGSNVAAAVMNALLYSAADSLDPEKRYG